MVRSPHSICIENIVDLIIVDLPILPRADNSHFLFQSCYCFNLNLTISLISDDLDKECDAVSSFLPPGENVMYDGMPELVDYDDVVADLLMVILPQNRGSLQVHGLSCYSASSV